MAFVDVGRVLRVMSGVVNVALVGALSIVAVESASEISEVMQFVSVRNETEVDLVADKDPSVDAAPILILLPTIIQGLSLLVVMIASKNYKRSTFDIDQVWARILMLAPYFLFFITWFSVSVLAEKPDCYHWWPSYTLTLTSSVPIGVFVIVQCCILGLSKVSDTIITHVIGAPILLHMVFVSVSLYNFPEVVNFNSKCEFNSQFTIAMGVINYLATGGMLLVWLINNPPWKDLDNNSTQSLPESTELRECESSQAATAGDVEPAEHQEDALMTSDTQPLTDRSDDQEQGGVSRSTPSTTSEPAENVHGVGDESSPIASSVNEPPVEYQGEDVFVTSDTTALITSV